MAVTIRRAEESDLPWLIEQLKAFARFTPTQHALFPGEEAAQSTLRLYIAEHVVLIAERGDGERMGFIAGLLFPHGFNPALRVLQEVFWWVADAHRGTRAGLMLLNAFNTEGERLGAHWIVMSLERESPVRDETLTRRGFHLHERSFLREVW